MHLSVTFKNLNSSDHLKEFIQGKLDRMDKLLDHPGKATAVLKVEHQKRIVEINLTSNRLSIDAKEEHDDMHAAIDLVMDKLKKQVTKNKEKIQQRRTRSIREEEALSVSDV